LLSSWPAPVLGYSFRPSLFYQFFSVNQIDNLIKENYTCSPEGISGGNWYHKNREIIGDMFSYEAKSSQSLLLFVRVSEVKFLAILLRNNLKT
jgi:hypothetical protein